MDDTQYMRMALDLARKGWGYTSPNPMVGAVVVKDGEVIGKGFHERVGGPHAEVNAIDDAGAAARGADLYVTLEPCNHTGRTPPCTEKILAAGIRRVFVAMDRPQPPGHRRGRRLSPVQGAFRSPPASWRQEAQRLNEMFVKFMKTRRPFVILKCASTLDGRIATRTGDARWITGEASRAYVHHLRHGVDGIMVGIGTVLADNPSLTTRLDGDGGVDPTRIILDTRLSIPEDAKVLTIASSAGYDHRGRGGGAGGKGAAACKQRRHGAPPAPGGGRRDRSRRAHGPIGMGWALRVSLSRAGQPGYGHRP